MNSYKLEIHSKKNLLAFSGGVDSTALFFLLLENNISFDIAIVDYSQRIQSKDEVVYATQLAHKYNKKCFISQFPNDLTFNEKSARDYRYSFFDEIMHKNNYDSLLTAHQLNDKLEWFLMQLTKGAGLPELIGMKKDGIRSGYKLLKPLLDISKKELQEFLDIKQQKYFIDKSNFDEKYRRNYFRHNFTDKLVSEYSDGIAKSFQYLENDHTSLFYDIEEKRISELLLVSFNEDLNIAIRLIDKELKKRGIIISNSMRKEIIEKKEVVVSHSISVSIFSNKIYLAPYLSVSMNKKFKDKCRIHNIPKNIRPYLFTLYEKGLFSF